MSGLDEDIDSLQALYIHVLTLSTPLKKERLMAEKNKITQQKKKKRRLGLTNIGFRHPSLTKQYFFTWGDRQHYPAGAARQSD